MNDINTKCLEIMPYTDCHIDNACFFSQSTKKVQRLKYSVYLISQWTFKALFLMSRDCY